MNNYFVTRGLSVNITRSSTDGSIHVNISSDYSRSIHKGRLHVDGKKLAADLESLWQKVKAKTAKVVYMHAHFSEIDYYDNLTDVYTTPIVKIRKGKRKAEIGELEHGAIPKDWEIIVSGKFDKMQKVAPIMDFIDAAAGLHRFDEKTKKELDKKIRLVLQGKEQHANVANDY